uniref:Peptidase M28 n=1 Tax=Solibacter usitatus (strain Ellin6076) TaxID=234267 RepID=Q02D45_SOLUE
MVILIGMKRLALLLGAATLFAADYAAEGDRWWAHIAFLADDKLQGRDVGSDGFKEAAKYVAGKMETYGLKPAGTSGYYQPVKFETRQLVEDETSLTLVRDGKAETLDRADATLSTRADLAPVVEAGMVFVGYGLKVPEAKYDDLAGMDLRGKIAVYVNSTGALDAPGPVKSHVGSGSERWKVLQAAGAIGTATIMNPRPSAVSVTPLPGDAAAGGGRGQGGRGAGGGAGRGPQKSFLLADPELQEATGQKVALTITRTGGPKFFEGSGYTMDEILKLAMDNKPLPHFEINGKLISKAVMKRESVEAPNVAGMLPGSDPKLKNEYVIMSAHLDHVGVGRAVNGDNIYNGAMDDASGIASILEIARIMKESGAKPRRSILFLAVTAEEKGELGSRYFAMRPTVDRKQIVADINLDMFMPLFELKWIEVQGLAESTLGDTVRAAAKEYGVQVQADKEPDQNRFVRSDQYSFIRNGVPSLAFKFGYEFGTPEDKIFHDWVRDRYHKPSDDLNQPVDKASAAKFDRVIVSLLQMVADAPARPQWKDDSFFKRFAK